MRYFVIFFLMAVGFSGTAFAQFIDGEDDEYKSGILVTTTGSVTYEVPYSITSGTVDKITPICDAASAIVLFTSDIPGRLTLDIPRNLLDSSHNERDADFFVLLDGEEINFEETGKTHSREIRISFEAGSYDLEIITVWAMSLEIEGFACKAVHYPPYSYILPPLKQIRNDVSPEDVICEPNLTKAYKFSTGKPVCVKPSSIEELSERKWTIESNNPDTHILKYSPVLFKGTGIIADNDSPSHEDLQNLQQRKIEIDRLLEDRSISEKIRDELSDERSMIQYYAQQSFDEGVPFEVLVTLWEKRIQLREFLSTHDRTERFPIACTGSISMGFHAYSLDEKYVDSPTALTIEVSPEHFTKTNLQKADKIIREQVGEKIDIVYEKSDCYAVPTE